MFVPRESDGDGRENPIDLKAQESRRPLEAAFVLLEAENSAFRENQTLA